MRLGGGHCGCGGFLLHGERSKGVVRELLGHCDVATTQIYTHVDQGRRKAIHTQFHPRR